MFGLKKVTKRTDCRSTRRTRLGIESLEYKAMLTIPAWFCAMGLEDCGGSEPDPVEVATPAASTEGDLLVLSTDIDADAGTAEIHGGIFTLGPGSDGIEPPAEDMTIGIGDFGVTIAAGSFEVAAGGGVQFCLFHGTIDGVDVEVEINQTSGPQQYIFTASFANADLSGLGWIVPISVSVGDDSASTTAWNL